MMRLRMKIADWLRALAFVIVNPTMVRPSLRTRISSSTSIVLVAFCGLRKLM